MIEVLILNCSNWSVTKLKIWEKNEQYIDQKLSRVELF